MSTTGFQICSRFDEALDLIAMGDDAVAKFRELGDFSQVKFREGKTATIFFCRRLRTSEMQSVRAHVSEADIYAAAFARGVMKVEGLRGLDAPDDAERRTWVRPDPDRPVSTREIDEVFAAGDVFEIGAAIYGRSILPKGRPAAWPQPATSRTALQAVSLLIAVQTAEADARSHQSKSAPAAPQAETGSG